MDPDRTALERLAGIDPLGVLPRVVRVSRGLPGFATLDRRVERALADEPEDADAPALAEKSPAAMLDELLQRSMYQTPAESIRSLVELILREIVPDEARILAALADGDVFPLLHVEGPRGRGRLIENVSSVGRAAGVALPARVPLYLSHLFALGLAETGPEDPKLNDEYGILLTDSAVRAAFAEANGRRRSRPRLVKGTVRISDLGREVWETCRNGDA